VLAQELEDARRLGLVDARQRETDVDEHVVARRKKLRNFSMLVSQVLVPPAMTAILDDPENRVRAFLGPGHVCSVMGVSEYHPIAEQYGVPIVVTGFEPVDMLEGVLRVIRASNDGTPVVDNQYGRSVRADGNPAAQKLVGDVFEVCDRSWRGIGTIAKSGYRLRDEYREQDAEARFDVNGIAPREPPECISGLVLRGLRKPHDCPAFGSRCTPDHPLGATMVSSEGACAAYHTYGRTSARTRLPIVENGAPSA
jgi:hydrogenase expression/formation protein HypD